MAKNLSVDPGSDLRKDIGKDLGGDIGGLGEKIAIKYLTKKGYKILDKNYKPSFVSGPQTGEIDIVAKFGGTISFIEVKALNKKSSNYYPENKVDFLKQRKIIKTAERWLMEKKISLDSQWQVDVIAIEINLETKKAKIRYLANAV